MQYVSLFYSQCLMGVSKSMAILFRPVILFWKKNWLHKKRPVKIKVAITEIFFFTWFVNSTLGKIATVMGVFNLELHLHFLTWWVRTSTVSNFLLWKCLPLEALLVTSYSKANFFTLECLPLEALLVTSYSKVKRKYKKFSWTF